ncbi:MAG: DUF91 domain-containing protein [Chitinivibrionales bacterium]|nr:DUF91 domain-containing protein [Chitinivibrionales bacterium]
MVIAHNEKTVNTKEQPGRINRPAKMHVFRTTNRGPGMDKRGRPFIWEMIREAIEAMGGKSTNVLVRDWILERYPEANANTIQCHIIICTVNHQSRVHYPENQKPRRAESEYDFLYRPSPGKLELYDSRIHGQWEIVQDPHGFLFVRRADTAARGKPEEIFVGGGMIEEKQLRTYLARSLDSIQQGLELFVDDMGNDGLEYLTDIGAIDILCVDREGNFHIVVLKVERTAEEVSGQILGFMNWIKQYLAGEKAVWGYVIATQISPHMRYALANREDIFLKEYEINIILKDVEKA